VPFNQCILYVHHDIGIGNGLMGVLLYDCPIMALRIKDIEILESLHGFCGFFRQRFSVWHSLFIHGIFSPVLQEIRVSWNYFQVKFYIQIFFIHRLNQKNNGYHRIISHMKKIRLYYNKEHLDISDLFISLSDAVKGAGKTHGAPLDFKMLHPHQIESAQVEEAIVSHNLITADIIQIFSSQFPGLIHIYGYLYIIAESSFQY